MQELTLGDRGLAASLFFKKRKKKKDTFVSLVGASSVLHQNGFVEAAEQKGRGCGIADA